MRNLVRDGMEALVVVAAATIYALWATGTALSGMSTRTVAIVVFALGFVGCTVNQSEMAEVYGVDRSGRRPHLAYVVTASALGAVALIAGIWAVVVGSEVMLITLLAAMVGLWAVSTVRHRMAGRAGRDDGSATTRPSAQAGIRT